MRRTALKKQVRLYLLTEDWVIQFVPNPGVSGIRYGSKWRLLAEYAAAKLSCVRSCVQCIARLGRPRLAREIYTGLPGQIRPEFLPFGFWSTDGAADRGPICDLSQSSSL